MNIAKKMVDELLKNGYTYEDIEIIEQNARNIKCFLCDDNDDTKEAPITQARVKSLIGEYNFLTAIRRAVYCRSAVRNIEDSSEYIYFERK